MLYTIISYFADSHFGGLQASTSSYDAFFLIGSAVALVPAVILFLMAMYGASRFSAIFFVLSFLSVPIGIICGIQTSTYPIQYNRQFVECTNVGVDINYRSTTISAIGVECHTKAKLDDPWSDWKFDHIIYAVPNQ